MDYEDTYFLNSEEALKVAKEQNKKNHGLWLQACYYDGEKIESDLPNLIHLPLDNLVDDLAMGLYRIPLKLEFAGLDISEDIKMEIFNHFKTSVQYAQQLRNELNKHYIVGLRNATLDFSEPLRFYLAGHVSTQVMQHVSRNIVDALRDKGYEVLFNLDYGVYDPHSYKLKYEFNPHVSILINHFEQDAIANNDRFSFAWFQDPMASIASPESVIDLNERDYVFSLLPVLDTFLEKKDIPFQRQSFCINTNLFKRDENIEKKEKIIFVGSSYDDSVDENVKQSGILNDIKKLFYAGKDLDEKIIRSLCLKYNLQQQFDAIYHYAVAYVVRVNSVIELCKLKTDYEIEVYGYGWENIPEVQPYFKGSVEYGEDLVAVYNSAKYVLSPHTHYILQQRVLEAAACGAIPVVYDCRANNKEGHYENSILMYKSIKEMKRVFGKEVKNLQEIVEENSYDHFADRIINIVKSELENGR